MATLASLRAGGFHWSCASRSSKRRRRSTRWRHDGVGVAWTGNDDSRRSFLQIVVLRYENAWSWYWRRRARSDFLHAVSARHQRPNSIRSDEDPITRRQCEGPPGVDAIVGRVDEDAARAGLLDIEHALRIADPGM